MDATAIATIIAAVGASLTAFFAGVYKTLAERNDKEKKDLKDSNNYLNQRLDELRTEVGDDMRSLKAEITELRTELESVRKERDEAQTKVIQLQAEVKTLTKRLDKYEKKSK